MVLLAKLYTDSKKALNSMFWIQFYEDTVYSYTKAWLEQVSNTSLL